MRLNGEACSKGFAQAFPKACRLVMFSKKTHDEGAHARSNRLDRRSRLARREIPYRSKRHRRVNAKPRAWQRGTTQVGGSPDETKAILILCTLFSLAQEAQEKSLAKKKRRRKGFAACARRPTLRALDWRSLFEKSDVKTFIRFALNRSINPNLKSGIDAQCPVLSPS